MQETVYRTPIYDVDDLSQRLIAAWSGLQQYVIGKAIDHWWKRLRACVRANGLKFEHFLWLYDCLYQYFKWIANCPVFDIFAVFTGKKLAVMLNSIVCTHETGEMT